jgi:hypothetical protein
MKVQLSEGPLDGTAVDVDEDSSSKGSDLSRVAQCGRAALARRGTAGRARHPRVLYEGSGIASYVAGLRNERLLSDRCVV